MRRLAVVCAAMIWTMVSAGAVQNNAARRPDFSGTWVLEGSSSDAIYSPLGSETVLKQDADAMVYSSRGREITIRFGVPETRFTTTTVTGDVWQHVAALRWIQHALLVTDREETPIGTWEDGFVLAFQSPESLSVTAISTPKTRGPVPTMIVRSFTYVRK